MKLLSVIESIFAGTIYFPAISSDHSSIAFYTPLKMGMGITTLELGNWQSHLFIPSPLPSSVTVGLVTDLQRHRIIYASDNKGDEQYCLYCLDTLTEETRCLTPHLPGRWMPIAVSPNGRWLSALSDCTGMINIWRLPLEEGDLSPSHFKAETIFGGKWSPDSRWLTASVVQARRVKSIAISFDDQEIRQLSNVTSLSVDRVNDWNPFNKELVITSEQGGESRIGALNLSDGSTKWIENHPTEQAIGFSPSGKKLLTLKHRPDGDSLVIYEPESANKTIVCDVGGQVDLVAFASDKSVVTVQSKDITPPHFNYYDLKGGSFSLAKSLYPNSELLDFVSCEHITYKSEDGTPIPALIYMPKNMTLDGNPAIVVLHGGPGDHFRVGYDPIRIYVLMESEQPFFRNQQHTPDPYH